MKTFKTRHQFYLPDDLSASLDALAATPGNSKTAILTEVLPAWLDRKAVNELDDRFGPRMDRQQCLIQRVETTLNIAAQVLDLFVRHQMTIVAHQPLFDPATERLGLKRYRALMGHVARRLLENNDKARLRIYNKARAS